MKLAFLFSAQGAQYAGMGKDLYENNETVKQRIDEADNALNYDLKKNMFEDEEALASTRYVQTAIFTLSAAIRDALKEEGIISEGSVGLSLGEYGALYDRGAFSFYDGLQIVEHRSFFMDQAVKEQPGTMAAVRGTLDVIEPLVTAIDNLHIANYNLPNQYVISGTKEAVDQFTEQAKEKGIRRVTPLRTAGAFHSPFMNEASEALRGYLRLVDLNEPLGDLYLNTTGKKHEGEDLKTHMVNQISHPVKFYPAIEAMIAEGYDTFVELGVKNTLASMVKKIDKTVKTLHVEDYETLKKTIEELKNNG